MRQILFFIKHQFRRLIQRRGEPASEARKFDPHTPLNHKPIFAVGTGRSGTHFFYTLMSKDPNFLSSHLDSLNVSIADSFIQYSSWYSLNTDLEPFLEYRRRLIAKASQLNKIYFESNPYLSLIASTLNAKFNAKILLLIRNPIDAINSHFVKGWYDFIPVRSNPRLVPVIPPDMPVNHFLGRIMPLGNDYEAWEKLTRVGKIAWWWNTLNLNIYAQLKDLPSNSWRIVKLDNFGYRQYQSLHSFFEGKKLLKPKTFEKLCERRPGKGKSHRSFTDWSAREKQEYLHQTAEARKVFDYTE
jgi:hypothetical protein